MLAHMCVPTSAHTQVVAGTNTGKSPLLAGYYAYWERAIFNALNAMVSNAMNSLQQMIDSRSKRAQVARAKAAGKDPLQARAQKLPPLFKVGVSLQNIDIVIQPPINEVGVVCVLYVYVCVVFWSACNTCVSLSGGDRHMPTFTNLLSLFLLLLQLTINHSIQQTGEQVPGSHGALPGGEHKVVRAMDGWHVHRDA